jgi:rapamycin-insensitive companion of mTOR
MAEVLHMANKVLPLSLAAKLQVRMQHLTKASVLIGKQTIPRIFELASDYDHGEHRTVGTLALSAIDSFNRNKARLEPSLANTTRPR